ncbi:MAG: hypothetical protein Q9M33_02485, partial [Robiginitomaculum sp.]|nr:hypothetical protein [Robiginitomaculum sp.]
VKQTIIWRARTASGNMANMNSDNFGNSDPITGKAAEEAFVNTYVRKKVVKSYWFLRSLVKASAEMDDVLTSPEHPNIFRIMAALEDFLVINFEELNRFYPEIFLQIETESKLIE